MILLSVEVFVPLYSGQIDFHPVVSGLLKPSFAFQVSEGNSFSQGLAIFLLIFMQFICAVVNKKKLGLELRVGINQAQVSAEM